MMVNQAWKNFGRANGLQIPNFGVGLNYLHYCSSEEPGSSRFVKDLTELLAGRLDLLTHVYPCHSPRKNRWFSLIGLPLSLDNPAGVALLHVNITEMLPLSDDASPLRVKTDEQRRRICKPTNLSRVSGSIARSVSQDLISQLNNMIAGAHQSSPEQILRTQLSKRQKEVFRLLGTGKTNKQIAESLYRSPNTIKLHVSAILKKLQLKSRTQAALLAIKQYHDI